MLARAARRIAARPFGTRGIVFKTDASVKIEKSPLTEFLLQDAAKHGDENALIDGLTGRSIKYSELSTRIGSAAAGLTSTGFGPGKTLAVMLPNCPEYPIVFNAAAVAGGRVTTVNPLYTATELAHQLKDSEATMIVTAPPFKGVVEEAAAIAGGIDHVFTLGEESGAPFTTDAGVEAKTHESVNPDECLAIPYSSGTTGLPKGTMLSASNLVANITQIVDHPTFNLDMHAGEVVLGLLPAFHIYASTVVFQAALRVGATVVTLPKFEPGTFLDAMQTYKVTWAPLVPPLIHFLANEPSVDQTDLSSLRVIFSGAAPLDAKTQASLQARLRGTSVRQGYGMTELSPVSHITPHDDVRDGSVGRVIPECEAKFITEEGKEAEAGEVGELCVRGPNVMLGYLNNEEATRDTIMEDGFLRTGDIGYTDSDGHTFIVDRVKELIKVKGFQVAPAELEGILVSSDGIADAAVVGMPHERDGERPLAFVVRSQSEVGQNLTEQDVKDFVAAETVSYKHPDAVKFVDQIPKSASGKILRRVLKDEAMKALN